MGNVEFVSGNRFVLRSWVVCSGRLGATQQTCGSLCFDSRRDLKPPHVKQQLQIQFNPVFCPKPWLLFYCTVNRSRFVIFVSGGRSIRAEQWDRYSEEQWEICRETYSSHYFFFFSRFSLIKSDFYTALNYIYTQDCLCQMCLCVGVKTPNCTDLIVGNLI